MVEPSARKPALRRPVTGVLHIRVSMARQLAHAPARGFRTNETYCVLKVDSVQQARTRPSRQLKWNEDFELRVDKASELDITLYDKTAEKDVPIGLLWIKITEVTDEIRKMALPSAIGMEAEAEAKSPTSPSGSIGSQRFQFINQLTPKTSSKKQEKPEKGEHWIEAWWDVEPVGQIHMRMKFVRDGGTKLTGLGRNGAMRVRKEDVHELNGHKFFSRQFYQIMRCAFCLEFLFNTAGYQCEDCRYLCHKRCYPKVVTKCVSRVSYDVDPDEEKLNHRIPHRFESFSNFAANWCNHCGYMLPLGGKGNRRCTGTS